MTTRDPEATAADHPGDWAPRRAALLAGPAAAIVLVGGIFLAAYAFGPTPAFDWTGELDQFGVLRHYSIALGGLLGLVFLWAVWTESTTRLQRAGVGIFAVGFGITAGANALAAAGGRAGDWAVLGLVFLFPVALLVYGVGAVSAGHRRRGNVSLLLGGAYLGNVWLVLPLPPAPRGYELTFYVGSFILVSVWTIVTYLALRE